MKVFVIGATGNLGSRLIPALLTHGHQVVAYVRSESKLASILPEATHEQITVIQGSATDSQAIKRGILDTNCDAVINTAGLAAMAPWKKSDLPQIFRAIVKGVQEAGAERKQPLRAWFLGGMGVLYYPGTQTMLSSYMPIFLEHRQDLALLKSLPDNTIDWSMLCPSFMTPETTSFDVPTKSSSKKLIAGAGSPPMFKDSWIRHIPFLGRMIMAGINAGRYETTLEQNAELIASDLETRESRFIGTTVGVISA